MKQLIHNSIQTPDGTILTSKHRHDFVCHLDKNGEEYQIDGGLDYQRGSVNTIPARDLSVYDDEPHKIIREYLERGSYGKEFDQSLKYIKLKNMTDDHLEAVIKYEEENRPSNRFLKHYKEELEWRKIGNTGF